MCAAAFAKTPIHCHSERSEEPAFGFVIPTLSLPKGEETAFPAITIARKKARWELVRCVNCFVRFELRHSFPETLNADRPGDPPTLYTCLTRAGCRAVPNPLGGASGRSPGTDEQPFGLPSLFYETIGADPAPSRGHNQPGSFFEKSSPISLASNNQARSYHSEGCLARGICIFIGPPGLASLR